MVERVGFDAAMPRPKAEGAPLRVGFGTARDHAAGVSRLTGIHPRRQSRENRRLGRVGFGTAREHAAGVSRLTGIHPRRHSSENRRFEGVGFGTASAKP